MESEIDNQELLDLINRLRGIYIIPVNDGAGLLDGKDTFTRQFDSSPIKLEAAQTIEDLLIYIETLESFIRTKYEV